MIKNYNVVIKLVERYDYGGVLELLTEIGAENTPLGILIDSCRYAINFDFNTSLKILEHLSDEHKSNDEIKYLRSNLRSLIEGQPDTVFSELLENTKFQIVSEEYIDFLGRVYRFKEAIYKYMFIITHLDKKNFSMLQPIFQKRYILNTLRKRYHIRNYNLIYGIDTYLKKYNQYDENIMEVTKILNSHRMTELLSLRNNSIVGHGFCGVSSIQIQTAYGNPYQVIEDFKKCLKLVNIKYIDDKYIRLNILMKLWLDEIELFMNEEKF